MSETKGKPVRPITASSIRNNRLNRVASSLRDITFPVHPVVVELDLKRGCLTSLDLYLRENPGQLDRRIAVALRKLISGKASRSKYRLVIIDHPGAPKAKGGKPRENQKNWERDEAMVRMYDALIAEKTKPYIAPDEVARNFGVSPRTVTRVLKAFDRSRLEKSSIEATLQLRDEALANLRSKSTGQEDNAAPTS